MVGIKKCPWVDAARLDTLEGSSKPGLSGEPRQASQPKHRRERHHHHEQQAAKPSRTILIAQIRVG